MSVVEGIPDFSIAAGRATIRLNRPTHHNRLERADFAAMAEMIDRVDADEAVRVLVLTATGKTFCAGYDLKDLAGSQGEAPGNGAFVAMVDKVEACRVPVICALNGPVYGGGTDLALACDIRIGVLACRILMPAGRFGLHYYHSGMRRYVTRLGLGAAKRLFLLGETLDTEEMRRIGYLDEIVADEVALAARVDAMAGAVCAAASAGVICSMKRELNRIAAGDMDAAVADAAWGVSRRSAEVAAAVAGHLAGRRGLASK
jgi:enoyl-CoA hydratase/carnithine racemase